ncbi:E3 SUMO-protein ligase ZBED1-like [Styela clava]
MKEFCKKVIEEMEQRFSFDIGDIAHKAAAVDPRYKLKGLSSVDSTQIKGALELDLAKILQKHSPTHSEAAAPSIQSSPQLSPVGKILKLAFDSSESDSSTDTDPVSMGDEINKYFSLKVVADNKDPLIWWKENENLFPNLVKLVHKYLGIPATSTPSERVFSVARNTATELRSSLTGSHVEALVFLKANKDLWISK